MKVFFPDKDPKAILGKIKEAFGGRELGKIVEFSTSSSNLLVTISKLGTSTLKFDREDKDEGIEYTLSKESIAFTHRAFKDDITDKIVRVLEQAGGKVTR